LPIWIKEIGFFNGSNMTMTPQSAVLTRPRQFPSRLVFLAAAEFILIALLLRSSNTQKYYPAVVASGLCAAQLGILLINRFTVSTRKVRRIARSAEFSSQPTFITDLHGRIKWANPRFTRLTGFGLSELAGRMFSMVLHGQETDTRTVEKIRDRIRLQLPFETEILQYDHAGLRLWVYSKGQPIHDHRGQVTHYVVTQADITEERRQSRIIMDALTKPGGIASLGSNEPILSAISPGRVQELTRKLEQLGGADNRDQLKNVVEGIRNGVKECIEVLPVDKHNAPKQAGREEPLGERNSSTPRENPQNNGDQTV
jgi:PAS domain S-box-containing protein